MASWKNTVRLAAALLALCLSPAFAEITQTINYQGFLLSKLTNLPVETPQDIKFVIYDAASGGTARFSESRCNVAVNKGRYDVEIGSMTSGGIPASVFTSYQNLWLEIQLDSDGDCSGTYESMTPRVRLQASPFAFNSLYASTASAATSLFRADIIGALPETTYGAVTISTNLFVQGGISVGSISPGQKLAVAGVVESTGDWPTCGEPPNYTCGFKFPDGSIQVKAAANTQWDINGGDVFSINTGNIAIGENNSSPLARLHVSTAAGDTGDILLVSTGTSKMFRVNGLGEVYAGSYYGNGATLTGIVGKAGATMTGQLTLAGSSLTVTSAQGLYAVKHKLGENVELSSTTAARQGGIYISTNVWLPSGAKYYGDGSQLQNVTTNDNSKVFRTGDTMTGQLTLANSTLTVTGDAFSVTGSTFSIFGGSVAVGGASYPVRLTVTGGILATSSITAQGTMYSAGVNSSGPGSFTSLTAASSGTFQAFGATQYSVETASGIKVNYGVVTAPYFSGNGSLLTSVTGTDPTRLLKAGDTMTGNLFVAGASVTLAGYGTNVYALTVASAAAVSNYTLAVTTAGYVGVQVNSPASPLDVRGRAQITNSSAGDAQLYIYSDNSLPPYTGSGSVRWSNYGLSASPGGISQGVLGFPGSAPRDLVYRSNASDPSSGGSEVFRISSDDNAYWRFGIGTNSPTERFHVASNMLVSTSTLNPILYISTASGRVSISTTTQTHALTVNGGITAVSSITAQAGFYGDGAGIFNIGANSLPQQIRLSTITAVTGSTYGAVVFASNTYVNAKLAVGGIFTPAADASLHVKGITRLDQKNDLDNVVLNFYPTAGDSFIKWDEAGALNKGVLGMASGSYPYDLVYKAAGDGGVGDLNGGVEAFRVKQHGQFVVGGSGGVFNPTAKFHVFSDMMVSTNAATPILYISTASNSVGISTGAPKERMHVASSFLVGADHASAALFVSTASGYTGVGTDNPKALLTVGNGNLLAEGSFSGTQSLPASPSPTRLMWVPTMAAFRAGHAAGAQWDNLGSYSVAFGQNNVADSDYSAALGGFNNVASGMRSTIGGGDNNYIYGQDSVVPGGAYNVVLSSFSFAGGYNNHLMTDSSGTFVWSYDDVHSKLFDTADPFYVTGSFLFLIDPSDVKHYKVGIRTGSPQAALDVNGDAQFGSGATKSTFTAAGYWQPRSMTTAELQAAAPPSAGAVAFNSSINDLCVSTGSLAGQWALIGSKGTGNCY